MARKFKAPCWVKDSVSGEVLRCLRIAQLSRRMKHETGWKGLVLHVQTENGTGLMPYSRGAVPTEADMAAFSARVKQKFGI